MVGIVLVSHSHALAAATKGLIESVAGREVSVEIAAGIGEHSSELGTDAVAISEAMAKMASVGTALVFMDMGSAVLSAEMALDFLDDDLKSKVKLCSFPFVEGAVAAGVAAKIGGSLDEVYEEAKNSLAQKTQHLSPESEQKPVTNGGSKQGVAIRAVVPNPHGLHARPVARLIQLASELPADFEIKNISKNRGPVSLRSMTSIIALEILKGDEVEISSSNLDAGSFLQTLKTAIERGLGDDLKEDLPIVKTNSLDAVGICRGIVIAPVFKGQESVGIISNSFISDPESELKKMMDAVGKARSSSRERNPGGPTSAIFDAQTTILDDPVILEEAQSLVLNKAQSAQAAWNQVLNKHIKEYENLKDPTLRQRALDLKDVRNRVLKGLGVEIGTLDIPEAGILLIKNLTPEQVTRLDKNKILGVICLENGVTSHSSILLRSYGIPSVIQAQNYFNENSPVDGDMLIMDGTTGRLILKPDRKTIDDFDTKKKVEDREYLKTMEAALQPAVTLDSVRVNVLANVGTIEDSKLAAQNGADGIGLFRTEFMFVDRNFAPSEEEQVALFRKILSPMKSRPTVIRTLDAGGDKNIPYLNLPNEPNPFLGIRAIRLCLQNEDLFQDQLRAILRVSVDFNVEIMFPLIATLEELRLAKAQLEKAHQNLISRNIDHPWPIKTGMMMEVPSAALLAKEFAKEVDFFSIGTNDLIQYTLAADRGNSQLQQSIAKGLPIAVVRLIDQITRGAATAGIPVAVCGETASHPELAKILLDCGVSELSMNPKSIPEVKAWIRSVRLSD